MVNCFEALADHWCNDGMLLLLEAFCHAFNLGRVNAVDPRNCLFHGCRTLGGHSRENFMGFKGVATSKRLKTIDLDSIR